MLFGNKHDFAIEARVEDDLKPPSHPWGRMCIWVSGKQIGDYEDPHCGLYPAYEGFLKIRKSLDSLWCTEIDSLSDRETWNLFDEHLYGWRGNEEVELDDEYDEESDLSERYWKFNFLTNWGEMFDGGGKSFLLNDSSGSLRVLNFDYDLDVVNRYTCSKKGFIEVSQEFIEWYEEQLELFGGENA